MNTIPLKEQIQVLTAPVADFESCTTCRCPHKPLSEMAIVIIVLLFIQKKKKNAYSFLQEALSPGKIFVVEGKTHERVSPHHDRPIYNILNPHIL